MIKSEHRPPSPVCERPAYRLRTNLHPCLTVNQVYLLQDSLLLPLIHPLALLSPDLSRPEDHTVYVSIAYPARLRPLSQHLPLSRAGHFPFMPDESLHNELPVRTLNVQGGAEALPGG